MAEDLSQVSKDWELIIFELNMVLLAVIHLSPVRTDTSYHTKGQFIRYFDLPGTHACGLKVKQSRTWPCHLMGGYLVRPHQTIDSNKGKRLRWSMRLHKRLRW